MNPESPAPTTTVNLPLNFRRSMGWAALWVALDGFVLAQITFAMLCAGYVLFYALPRALIASSIRERRNYYLMRAAVFSAVPVLAGGLFAVNLHVGGRNAATIIAAADRYHAEHRQYPQTLQALVPKYLPEVPPAKYAFSASEFRYFARDNRYTLMYTTYPPFGRRVYDLTARKWSDLD